MFDRGHRVQQAATAGY